MNELPHTPSGLTPIRYNDFSREIKPLDGPCAAPNEYRHTTPLAESEDSLTNAPPERGRRVVAPPAEALTPALPPTPAHTEALGGLAAKTKTSEVAKNSNDVPADKPKPPPEARATGHEIEPSAPPTKGGDTTKPPVDGPPPTASGDLPPDPDNDGEIQPAEATMQTARLLRHEARAAAITQADPLVRLRILDAMIGEGDAAMIDKALSTLHEIPNANPEYPTRTNDDKLHGAVSLADTLSNTQHFTAAECVIDTLEEIDPPTAISAISDLLTKGYLGENGKFLEADLSSATLAVMARDLPTTPVTMTYLRGLAGYGIGLLDTTTRAGQIFSDSINAVPEIATRGLIIGEISMAYADGGHITKAYEMFELIAQPLWRGMAASVIAQAAYEQGDLELSEKLLLVAANAAASLASELVESPAVIDVNKATARIITLQIAEARAKQGNTQQARDLAGPLEPGLANRHAQIYAAIYSHTGDMSARASALEARTQSPDDLQTIRDIALADRRHGKMVRSRVAPEESVPLICWGMGALRDKKARLKSMWKQ